MKLTILAATGATGRHLLTQALAAGHQVTAVVRNPAKLTEPSVRTVTADLSHPDPEALAAAVEGADAVLSALGATSSSEPGVAWRGTEAIVAAMRATGVRRIVTLSAAPIGTVASPARPNPPKHDPGDTFLMRHVGAPLTRIFLREHYADLARMEDVLRAAPLDWTSVRPPRLTNGPLTAGYRTALDRNLPGGSTASRADVAHCMLATLTRPDTVGHTLGVAR
ncbi:NAD(P)-dependent oxidoreductase [Kitasatospora sp. P5_F3]